MLPQSELLWGEERRIIGIFFSASLFSGAAKFDLTDTGKLEAETPALRLAGPP